MDHCPLTQDVNDCLSLKSKFISCSLSAICCRSCNVIKEDLVETRQWEQEQGETHPRPAKVEVRFPNPLATGSLTLQLGNLSSGKIGTQDKICLWLPLKISRMLLVIKLQILRKRHLNFTTSMQTFTKVTPKIINKCKDKKKHKYK